MSRLCVLRLQRRWVSTIVLVIAPAATGAFVEVGAERGIGPFTPEEGHGTGLAAQDFDLDGDIDFFAPQAGGFPNLLYRNLGDGSFEEIGAQAGVGDLASSRSAIWLDYDGDGLPDLLVANDSLTASSSLKLYRQTAPGSFTDVTAAAGLQIPPQIVIGDSHHWGGIAAGDINNDSYLDIYTVQWFGPGHLFLNNTDGTFTDISASSGVAASNWGHQPVMADFNNDGWTDLYLAVDFDPNALWINQHNNTFLNQAFLVDIDNAMNDMGIALGDYDGDGDQDIYITNIFQAGPPAKYNVLYRNDTVGNNMDFTDVSLAMNVADGQYGWGATFADIDNDADLDLAATNGWRSGVWVDDPSRLFTSPGNGGPFVEEASTQGFADTEWGSALIAADLDRDGDLDFLQACMDGGPIRLLDNQPDPPAGAGNYLTVRLVGNGGNRFGIGARIRATVAGQSQYRWITAGNSYMGQEPAEAFFGLAGADHVDTLEIDWPGGTVTTLNNVSANQVLTVSQASGLPTPVPAASTWGMVIMLMLVIAAATLLFDRGDRQESTHA